MITSKVSTRKQGVNDALVVSKLFITDSAVIAFYKILLEL
jgi:hypothetical protein